MSPSRKSTGPRRPHRGHALRRHEPKAAPAARLPPGECRPLVRHLTALEAVGWRVVELRPLLACGAPALWRAAITRVDLDASMTVSATDPDAALAELVRYASADATEPR
jgi:hypothetical protein